MRGPVRLVVSAPKQKSMFLYNAFLNQYPLAICPKRLAELPEHLGKIAKKRFAVCLNQLVQTGSDLGSLSEPIGSDSAQT